MKLRIRANTIRLRLTQTEVRQLHQEGKVVEKTHIAPDNSLLYSLQSSPGTRKMSVSMQGNQILLTVPADMAADWAESDQVSMEGEQENGSDHPLSILIEKDFKCLKERPGEEDQDTYPHPMADQSC